MTASYLCNRLPHSAIKMGTPVKDALRIKRRPVAPQNHRREDVFPVQGRNKLGNTSWEETMCGLSQSGSNSFGIWNPKTRRVVERGNFVFVETPPHLLPPSRRASPLQGLEAPSFDFSDNSVDDNCTSREDDDTGSARLHNFFGLRRERPCRTTYCLASPGCFRLGESHRINHRHPLHLYLHLRQERHPHPPLYGQHCKQPPRAPTTTPWSPGFTSAVTRSYVRSPVATDNRQIGITSQLYQVSSTRKRLNRCTN